MPVKKYTRQIRKNPKIHGPKIQWSDNQRIEAVTTYLMVGNWAAVVATTGVPLDTLRHWKMQPWWKEYENDIKRSHNIQVSNKLQKIINKSADLVLDRIDNGDMIFNTKTGQVMRKGLSAKVAADIMTKSVDKDILIQKLDVKEEVQEEAILDRLKTIQDILRKNTRQQSIIDVEVINDTIPEILPAP